MKKIDLTREVFENLVVIKEVDPHIYPNGRKRSKYLCKCSCGSEVIVLSNMLKSGKTKSCGCYRRMEIKGLVFDRITVIEEVNMYSLSYKGELSRWRCKCSCGNYIEVNGSDLKSGNTKSCGCLGIKHGYASKNTIHPLYRVLSGMKTRCYNENDKSYKHYGSRKITICEEWLNDPKAFIEWGLEHGWEKGLQIDREENDGNYEPSNCRFVTSLVNNSNRRNSKKALQ